MIKKFLKKNARIKRHKRLRYKIAGTADCPRLSVYRANSNIYAQLIDDTKGVTLASASSLALELTNGGNIEGAIAVGTQIAKIAKEKNITKVVFDRGGCVYHGRVKALAEAARAAGLEF